MWISDYYIKPLTLMIIIAVIIFVILALVIKKIIGIIITAIILICIVGGGNQYILKNQVTDIVNGAFNKYKDVIKNIDIKSLLSSGNISQKDDEIKVNIEDRWYSLEFVKNNVLEENGKYYLNVNGNKIEIKSVEVQELLRNLG